MFSIQQIKNSINSSPRLTELSDHDLREFITSACMVIYALSGAAKNLTVDQYADELSIIVNELITDVKNEFTTLRTNELVYAFKLGNKDFFPIKTFGINYKTFYTWLDYYYKSDLRQKAIISIESEVVKLQLAQKTELTTAEVNSIMQEAINTAYSEFLNIQDKSKIRILTEAKHVFGVSNQGNIYDLCLHKTNYLRSQGLIKNNETLLTLFNKFFLKGKTKIF